MATRSRPDVSQIANLGGVHLGYATCTRFDAAASTPSRSRPARKLDQSTAYGLPYYPFSLDSLRPILGNPTFAVTSTSAISLPDYRIGADFRVSPAMQHAPTTNCPHCGREDVTLIAARTIAPHWQALPPPDTQQQTLFVFKCPCGLGFTRTVDENQPGSSQSEPADG